MINFWKCKYKDYDEIWNGEEETQIYNCLHKKAKYGCCDFINSNENCNLKQ